MKSPAPSNRSLPKEYSPFTPGQPVPLEFFVGRLAEVNHLKGKAEVAAATGRLQVAFLSGERGIGKSSLASFVRYLAERDNRFLGVHAFLGGVTSLEEMVRRVFDRLLKESVGRTWHEKVKSFFGGYVRKVGLFEVSIEFGAPTQDLKRFVQDFAPNLRKLIERLKEDHKGVFIVLDDINGLANSQDFANWLKSLVDQVATEREPLPLCLVYVGLEERRQSLIQLQPSLARIFNLVDIRAWKNQETREFFNQAFSRVNISVDGDAMEFLARYAGGLPMLAHEIGDAVFKLDTDSRIDRPDAIAGIVEAADIVGRKHLEPQVFQAIRSAKYRAILRKVSVEPFEPRFKRAELRARLAKEEEKVMDNFLTRMKDLGVIRPDLERGPGAYCFDNILHYLYFWLEAERAREAPE